MENQLIQLYLLVCHIYDTRSETCFQRLSNNSKPAFTDQELITIYLFGHLHGLFEKKAIYRLVDNYWRQFFPLLPAYQTFCARLKLLANTFQTMGGSWQQLLQENQLPEIDHPIDSMPMMLASGTHAFTARVAREVADVGYCASKKTYFHGVRLHSIAKRRSASLPLPQQLWFREASCHDLRSVKEQAILLPNSSLIGDKAYLDPLFERCLNEQQITLYTPRKKTKGKQLSDTEK